jgi:hypothetical protein
MGRRIATVIAVSAILIFNSFNANAADFKNPKLRMVVQKNMTFEYKIKTKSDIIDWPAKFIVSDKLFASNADDSSTFSDDQFFRFPGFKYAFVNPALIDLIGNQKTTFNCSALGSLKGERVIPKTLKLSSKAEVTRSGWSYVMETPKDLKDIYLQAQFDVQRIVPVEYLKVTIKSYFDKDKGMLKSATVHMSWKLGTPKALLVADPKLDGQARLKADTAIKKELSFIKGWKGRHSQKVTLSLGKEVIQKKRRVAVSKWDKNIELGQKYLLKKIRAGEASNPGTNFGEGSGALMFFAVLRAGTPTEEIEKELMDFAAMCEKKGYVKPMKGRPARCGYSAGCILMMIEAALNEFNTDKAVDPKKKKKKNQMLGSKELQEKLLTLAKACVHLLDADGPIVKGKYKQEMKTASQGHYWNYDGTRSWGIKNTGPHLSPAQYAVLGLRSAKLLNIPVAANVWADIHKGTLETYQKEPNLAKTQLAMTFKNGIIRSTTQGRYALRSDEWGYWGYHRKGRGHGPLGFNMNCAALGNVAMAYSELPEAAHNGKTTKDDMKKQMAAGLNYCGHLLKKFYGQLSYYDYYSWERVAVFYGIQKVKGKDWHDIMSQKIVDAQNMQTGEFGPSGKGSDFANKAPNLNTAYAVLFLKKATKPLGGYTSSSID